MAAIHTSCLSPVHGLGKAAMMNTATSSASATTFSSCSARRSTFELRLSSLTDTTSTTSSSVVRRRFAVGGGARSEVSTLEVADELVQLGKSDVRVSQIGIGAWSWGDTLLWNGSWDDTNAKETRDAFNSGMDGGLTFFDTAEVYGSKWIGGDSSESLLGRAIKDRQMQGKSGKPIVATKFAPFPWRFSRSSVVAALKDSLSRLGLPYVDLYQLHWPGLWGNEGFLDGLADAVDQGLVKAVGVSNYNEKRLRAAHNQLARRGVPLASNQVHYSLLYRLPEENGVKRTCDELEITLIAYSPLAQGILSGKYTVANPPSGPRGRTYNAEFLTKAAPLLSKMKEIGQRYDKSSTQVALNWLLAQGNVVPIPGAKSAMQASEFAGALGWELSKDEERELRTLSRKVQPVQGFPAEKF